MSTFLYVLTLSSRVSKDSWRKLTKVDMSTFLYVLTLSSRVFERQLTTIDESWHVNFFVCINTNLSCFERQLTKVDMSTFLYVLTLRCRVQYITKRFSLHYTTEAYYILLDGSLLAGTRFLHPFRVSGHQLSGHWTFNDCSFWGSGHWGIGHRGSGHQIFTGFTILGTGNLKCQNERVT